MTLASLRPLGAAAVILLPLPSLLGAQESPQLTFGAQVRPRMESRTPVQESRDVFTSMRVRASLAARLEGGVKVFVQLQDVRLFGEALHTLLDYRADGFDLHQGYLELESTPLIGGTLRVGRQEIALGEQRLVGAVDWAQQGRSFDGARYTSPDLGGVTLDLLAAKLQESTSPNHPFDGEFFGAWANVGLGGAGTLDAWTLLVTHSSPAGTEEVTLGALWRASAGPLDFRLEGSAQTGTRGGADVSAYMVGARAGGRLAHHATLTFWYDHLSGDDDPADGRVRVFNTLFATNHAFYGLADYFTDIPAHTGGLGLQDAAVKLALAPSPRTAFNVDLHHFRTARPGSLSTRHLANELDLTLTHRLAPAFTVTSGYSFVQAKDGIKELGRLTDNAHWAFVMLNASF
jgi:hypothetical protein